MKKIKKKKKSDSLALPVFFIGWTHGEPPPPGYLSAWFDQLYGGPLQIRFLSDGHHHFEAGHTNWKAEVRMPSSPEISNQWEGYLQWEHPNLAGVVASAKIQADRQDEVLHIARIARGLTLLLEGTAYDVASGVYSNPSDWNDRDLSMFKIDDHVQVDKHDQTAQMRTWLHTRGLTKFGLDEVEMFHPMGLSGKEMEVILYEVAWQLITKGKNPKVGERISFEGEGQQVEVVRHRTDPIYGMPLAFREIRLA